MVDTLSSETNSFADLLLGDVLLNFWMGPHAPDKLVAHVLARILSSPLHRLAESVGRNDREQPVLAVRCLLTSWCDTARTPSEGPALDTRLAASSRSDSPPSETRKGWGVVHSIESLSALRARTAPVSA